MQNAGSKAKVFLLEKILSLMPLLNKQNPLLVKSEVFPVAYRLMDEYSVGGRGKALSIELKAAAE